MRAKIKPDRQKIATAHAVASEIADDIYKEISCRSTDSIERSIARLLGVDGVDENEIPYPNALISKLKELHILEKGVARALGTVMAKNDLSPQKAAEAICEGKADQLLKEKPAPNWKELIDTHAAIAAEKIVKNREKRAELIGNVEEEETPYLYCIVATGNIYEDVIQAQAAAEQGAQIIAVIRSTAQSLLDYVPYGATTEGFGGTYATQENFKIMRAALDESSKKLGRYVRTVNYCSGLCMPEIAAMGALERLDMMLNDAMYGIIFRDINMLRTFTDQHFSRKINAFANIVINTGEDNYLTTSDAVAEAHTVLASQFINEQFGLRAGLTEEQMGLGHAFEMDPDLENGYLLELAQAQAAKEIFPRSPLKYMPPTKFMTGNIFRGHIQDALFAQISVLTGQTIHLLGMLTEAIHTPFMHDRFLSIEAAKYIRKNQRALKNEFSFQVDGEMVKRADRVLTDCLEMLQKVKEKNLFNALEDGMFAGIKRPFSGGKGRDGVMLKDESYYNPFDLLLTNREPLPAALKIEHIEEEA